MAADEPTPEELELRRRRGERAAAKVRETNRSPGIVRAVRTARELLPGDEYFGDSLSTADDRPSAVIARYLSERASVKAASSGGDAPDAAPTAAREAAMAGLQVWQALSHRVGRGAGTVEATVLFTDLCGFSTWVLEAGDELALELLRAVASVVEPAITSNRGRVVKRLGDGHMAAFNSPLGCVEAALEIQEKLRGVVVDGYQPRLRAGLHMGQPRQLGGDYLGTDVNIAARVSEAAGPGEVLVTGRALTAIGAEQLERFTVKRRRGFRAKGTPPGLEVFLISRR
jgi:adenylate cyclase